LGAPSQGEQDPSLLIGRTVELIGRLQADARVFETSCSALIDVEDIALWARGKSADCALIGAPHLVGDGPSGDGLAALTVGCVGLACVAAGGSFDRFGALD
jgi:hypothetical protein